MKRFLENVVRAAMLLLVAVLLWSVWNGSAQNTNNASVNAPSATNANAAGERIGDSPSTSSVLRKAMTPAWIEDLAEDYPFLKKQWLGNELWKYLGSLIYIFLAFCISKVLDLLTRVWLKKWAERSKTQFDDLLLGLLRGPVKIVSFVILLHIGLGVFDWPDVFENILSYGLKIVVACSLTYLALKFVDLVMGYWKKKTDQDQDKLIDDQLFPIVRKTLKVFVVVVAVLVTSQNLGFDITAVITSLGIGGLALALAAQDTLSNVFGAVAVFLDKPFRVGDRVQLDAVDGVVESIGLRSTRIRNLDGHLITVPNKTVGNATIINITRRPNIRTLMNIGVTYSTSTEKIQRAVDLLSEIYRGHPKTQDVWVSFNKFESASLNLFVIHWWGGTNYQEYLDGMQQLNLAIKQRFDQEKIEFAFPTQTLYLKQDSDWRLRGAADELDRDH